MLAKRASVKHKPQLIMTLYLRNIPGRRAVARRALIIQASLWLALDIVLIVYFLA